MRYLIETNYSDGVIMAELEIDTITEANSALKQAIRRLKTNSVTRDWTGRIGCEGVVYRYLSGHDEKPTPLVRFVDSGAYVELIPIEPWEVDDYA